MMKEKYYLYSLIIVAVCISGFALLKSENKVPNNQLFKDVGESKSFVVFDAVNFKGAPNLSSFGLHKIRIIYENALLSPQSQSSSLRGIDNVKLANQISRAKQDPDIPICLDVESWPLFEGKQTRAKSVSLYVNLLRTFKKETGLKNVSFFAFSANIPEIAQESDILFPSFYNYLYGRSNWKNNAMQIIKKLKRYNGVAPIYGFVCPQYIDAPGIPLHKRNTFLSYEDWKFELETMYEYCDGIVIWGLPYYKQNGKTVYVHWNEEWPWWKATIDFIREHNIQ